MRASTVATIHRPDLFPGEQYETPDIWGDVGAAARTLRTVLALIAETGWTNATNQQIAEAQDTNKDTVRRHLTKLYRHDVLISTSCSQARELRLTPAASDMGATWARHGRDMGATRAQTALVFSREKDLGLGLEETNNPEPTVPLCHHCKNVVGHMEDGYTAFKLCFNCHRENRKTTTKVIHDSQPSAEMIDFTDPTMYEQRERESPT